ncbi:MAG: cyclic nucleotide-binding domain-containing protein, partial [Bacteroidota bacterium]|nr:cyclic nucleotide-binding domain-containing protein [Bacteroidota bacterium]
MKENTIYDFIKKIELFNGLSSEELLVLSQNIKEKTFQENTFLFYENDSRKYIYIIFNGEVELFKKTPFGEEKRLAIFSKQDFLGEGSLTEKSPHSTNARAMLITTTLVLDISFFNKNGTIAVKVLSNIARVITRRMRHA